MVGIKSNFPFPKEGLQSVLTLEHLYLPPCLLSWVRKRAIKWTIEKGQGAEGRGDQHTLQEKLSGPCEFSE